MMLHIQMDCIQLDIMEELFLMEDFNSLATMSSSFERAERRRVWKEEMLRVKDLMYSPNGVNSVSVPSSSPSTFVKTSTPLATSASTIPEFLLMIAMCSGV